jgi:hypothetical protein
VIVSAKPVRPIEETSFTDLTPVAVVPDGVRWGADGLLDVEFTADLAPGVQAAVVRRMCSRNGNEEVLRERAEQALDANRAYLAVASPDAAAVRQQVERLTRQNVAIMRLLLGFLDGTD